MYRRQRRHPVSSILTVIFLGLIVGGVFMLFDHWTPAERRAPPPLTPGGTFTPEPNLLAGILTAQPTPARDTLFSTLRAALLNMPTPTVARSVPMLFAPTAGIFAPIIEVYLDGESWDVTQLGQNAGHLQGTAGFGKPGNMVLAGHIEMGDGRPGVFSDIGQLNIGDPVIVTYNGVEQRYYVTEIKTTTPDDLQVLYPTETGRLTLITCGDYNFFQNIYEERIVVIAEREA